MNLKRIFTLLLLAAVSVSLSSCFVWSTKISDNIPIKEMLGIEQPDFVDSVEKVIPNTPVDESGVAADTLMPEDEETSLTVDKRFAEEAKKKNVYRFNGGECAVVYDENGADIYDFVDLKVVPITDFNSMYTAADIYRRSRQYFEDYRIEYEFEQLTNDFMINFTVYSNTCDAYFKVYGFYTTDERFFEVNNLKGRGFRGYYKTEISYSGVDEPITITDLSDYGNPGVTGDNYIFARVKAFLETDVQALEELFYLESGTLSVWEGLEITDYTITIPTPEPYGPYEFRIIATFKNSNVERYPDGQYIITVTDGIDVGFDITPVHSSSVKTVYTEAEKWAHEWASHYGGWCPLEFMTPTNEIYAHHLLDFFGYIKRTNGAIEETTGEQYKEWCEKYFGFTDFENEYTASGVIDHGGHGLNTNVCEVETVSEASGIHIIEITYFADQLRSVEALKRRVTLVELGDGGYRIENVENIYETDLNFYGWAL